MKTKKRGLMWFYYYTMEIQCIVHLPNPKRKYRWVERKMEWTTFHFIRKSKCESLPMNIPLKWILINFMDKADGKMLFFPFKTVIPNRRIPIYYRWYENRHFSFSNFTWIIMHNILMVTWIKWKLSYFTCF